MNLSWTIIIDAIPPPLKIHFPK